VIRMADSVVSAMIHTCSWQDMDPSSSPMVPTTAYRCTERVVNFANHPPGVLGSFS